MAHTPDPTVLVPASLNVEALAVALAGEELSDWVYGEQWYGYPDPDNDAEMAEALERCMPHCRERARRYADLLLTPPD